MLHYFYDGKGLAPVPRQGDDEMSTMNADLKQAYEIARAIVWKRSAPATRAVFEDMVQEVMIDVWTRLKEGLRPQLQQYNWFAINAYKKLCGNPRGPYSAYNYTIASRFDPSMDVPLNPFKVYADPDKCACMALAKARMEKMGRNMTMMQRLGLSAKVYDAELIDYAKPLKIHHQRITCGWNTVLRRINGMKPRQQRRQRLRRMTRQEIRQLAKPK